MIAVDTNIVIRLLTRDDPQQTEQVRLLFANETILLPKTVILEVEWALRRLYHLGKVAIANALETLISLPNVRCEDEATIRKALDWRREGMDFADALHLSSSGTASRFATFDRDMIKASKRLGLRVSTP